MAARAYRQEAGFTYLGLMILVTVIGMAGAATLKIGSLLQRAEAEHELLEFGAAFSAALESYAAATPRGQPTQPTSLQDLLRDPRFPAPRRHLRKIFVDPVSGKAEWGILSAGEGGRIVGVYSRSQAKPLKIANFDARFINFENKKHLSDWKFTANGRAVVLAPPGLAGSAAAPRNMPLPLPQGLATPPVPATRQEQEKEQEQAAPAAQQAEPEPATEARSAGATER
jgi:type II secretory pathway pseudopilin PulG